MRRVTLEVMRRSATEIMRRDDERPCAATRSRMPRLRMAWAKQSDKHDPRSALLKVTGCWFHGWTSRSVGASSRNGTACTPAGGTNSYALAGAALPSIQW